jgi:hypothetical protein
MVRLLFFQRVIFWYGRIGGEKKIKKIEEERL